MDDCVDGCVDGYGGVNSWWLVKKVKKVQEERTTRYLNRL
jgi:hypothetical protein